MENGFVHMSFHSLGHYPYVYALISCRVADCIAAKLRSDLSVHRFCINIIFMEIYLFRYAFYVFVSVFTVCLFFHDVAFLMSSSLCQLIFGNENIFNC